MSQRCAELMEKQIMERSAACGKKVTIIRRNADLIFVRVEPGGTQEWFEPFVMHLKHLQHADSCEWSLTLKDEPS
jgi:hypothetical protein